MPKSTVVGTIVLSLALVIIVVWAAVQPQPEVSPSQTATSTPLALPANGYTEHAAYYDISANYPTTTPMLSLSAEANAAALAKIHSAIGETISQFKTDGNFDNLTSEDITMMGFDQGRKESLQIQYLIASSRHTVSYIFTIYEDTLGAHPNGFFKTLTFDTTTGAQLSLGDIFTPSSDYLGFLSTQSRGKLPDIIGKDLADIGYIKDGTTPDEKNFENFFFDNADFVILFPPYQVAAYAAGPQTLRLPISQLTNLLKPNYR